MREKDIYIITCAKCDKENRYEGYSCIGPDQRESIIDDSSKLNEMKKNTKLLAKKHSTEDICNVLLGTVPFGTF